MKALEGHINTLSEDSLNAVDDIGQYHFPKQVQVVTFGGINVLCGFSLGMPTWNDLTKKPKHQALHKKIVDAWKFSQMFCKVSYMWSELSADNKPQCVHTDFTPELVEKTDPNP